MLKKIAAAVAVKEIVENIAERVEQRRHPRASLASRFRLPALLAAGGGAVAWLYKNGKLAPVAEKIDKVRNSNSGVPSAPSMSPDAPAAVTGDTAKGTSSTAQNI
ncbi:MAG: hypothetical protein ACLGHL_09685 [Actinomycetota bacterium]